jgi:uncharacterized membrane protein
VIERETCIESARKKRSIKLTILDNDVIFTANTEVSNIPPVTAQEVYRLASRIGVVAGLRSMLPFALLAWTNDPPNSKTIQNVTALLALGEIIGDKLPITPSRLKNGPLLARIAIGALAGAILCRRAQVPVLPGVIRGAIGAGIGSVAGYSYRTLAAQVTSIPDTAYALLEDGAALAIGASTVTTTSRVQTSMQRPNTSL